MIAFLLIAFVPLAIAGLGLMNAGLGRARNASHALMAALAALSISVCVWFLCGASFMGTAGGAGFSLHIGATTWDWIGSGGLFLSGFLAKGSPALLVAFMGIMAAGLASQIPLGSAVDRWRLGAVCASTALLAGITLPLFAHWAWGGGWLAQLGANFGLGHGYLDPGGSGVVHVLGGLTALAVTWIVGPRRGHYSAEGVPMAVPGHNSVLVLFGCLLALPGFIAMNGAGALLFAGIDADRLPLIAVNTLLCAAGGALTAAVVTRVRFTKPDASLTANGWIGGLVASGAISPFLPPAAALLVGIGAGAVIPLGVELLDMRLEIDDPSGSISTHVLAGLWGLLAVGMFGRYEAAASGQLLAQIVGMATLFGFALPAAWALNSLLNLGMRQRASAEGEYQGMDLSELGSGAYPEFMTHSDDFMPR